VARHDILVAGTAIHAIVIAAMSGALSCAEERALGTHEWQLLQPMSARAQFAIKIAVVATLALVLAFGLPAILSLVPGGATESWPAGQRARAIPAILALTAGSVYISSLATSGLTALLLCIPGFIGVSMFINWFVPQVAFRAFMFFYRLPNGRLTRPLYRTSGSVDLLLACALILAVLWLAFSNHRESGRSFTRASLQLGVLAALILAVYTAFSAAGHAL
jgi:hypothetical protein